MGKIVATYLVKVTLREEDPVGIEAPADGSAVELVSEATAKPPTVESLGTFIGDSIAALLPGLTANASAERTDV